MSLAVSLDTYVPTDLELEAIVYGSEVPRVFTAPLRDVDNDEEATLGFEVIDFAELYCGVSLMPWQRWWLRHALELRLDGSLRFATILTLISRQNGKTFLLKIVCLYFLYIRRVRLILGVAQDLTTARESLMGALELAEAQDDLKAEFVPNPRGRHGYEAGSGREIFKLTDPGDNRLISQRRYMIKAANGRAGRGLSVDLLILDELREWRDTLAWGSLSKTIMARDEALTLAISNAGDDGSLILNNVKGAAEDPANDRIALFEWSAPDNIECTCGIKPHASSCKLRDVAAMAMANPSMGHRGGTSVDKLLDALATDDVAVFRTECLCQNVPHMNTLISEAQWRECSGPQREIAVALDPAADRIAAVLDLAPDGEHATLVAAACDEPDAPVRMLVVASWTSATMANLDTDLPELLAKLKPRRFGWFPQGPAAEKATALRAIRRSYELANMTEACQELVGLIRSGKILHADDPLLTAHVTGSKKLDVGDGYRFARKGAGHVDAAYAAAGAAKLARQLAKKRGMVV